MSFTTKVLALAVAMTMFTSIAFGQASCSTPTANATLVRAEGTSEQVGQFSFTCSAGFASSVPAGAATVQLFLSPSLPVTSKVLNAATGATEALIQVNNSGNVQGIVNGSTITFSGVQVPVLGQGGSYTVTISNVRVNATTLSVGGSLPPAISEAAFISGSSSSINPAAVSATVAFAQNGLGISDLRKAFTIGAGAPGTVTGWPAGTGTVAGVNTFAVCNAYSPVADNIDITAAGTASGGSLAFVVRVAENFASAFKTAGAEQPQIGLTAGVGNAVTAGTRFQIAFANVPANVNLFVPNGRINTNIPGSAQAQLTAAAAGTVFSSVAATTSTSVIGTSTGLAFSAGNSLAPVSLSAGSGSAVFEILVDDASNLDRFDIPVYVVMAANTVAASATPMRVSVSYSPIGSTVIPNFVVSGFTVSLTGPVFSGCNVSQSIAFTAPGNVSFGGPVTLTATATSGLSVNFASNTLPVCTVSGSVVTLLSAGACSITASQAGNGTYAAATPVTQSFTISPVSQTINFTQPANAVLAGGAVTLTATAGSGLAVSFASTIPSSCTVSNSTVTLVSVGSCAITASQTGNATYAAATPVTRTFSVLAPANLVTLAVGTSSGSAGRTVELPIAISATGTAAPAGLQMDLGFDAAKLSFVSARVGEQSTASGKSLSSSTLPNGLVRLLISGVNQNTIAAGAAAYASFQLTNSFTSGTSALTATNCASTDISGGLLLTSCAGGLIRYATCDINGDGNINVSDVQLVINQALGVVPATNDLNGDGAVNVADVQIVINAVLGLGCNTR